DGRLQPLRDQAVKKDEHYKYSRQDHDSNAGSGEVIKLRSSTMSMRVPPPRGMVFGKYLSRAHQAWFNREQNESRKQISWSTQTDPECRLRAP
ncbi:MAG: hypothetical protein WBR28_15170, partial [Mycobacterium sp.]